MKAYQKKYQVSNPTPSPLSVLPDLETGLDPKVGDTSVLIFNHKGDYIGWCSPEAMKKFLYGKLYYKTKGMFSINTAKNRRYSGKDKTVSIKEKTTGNIALIAVTKILEDADMVDATNTKEKAIYQLNHEIQPLEINRYNYNQIPDKYDVLGSKFKVEIGKEAEAYMIAQEKATRKFFADLKKKVADQLQSVIDGEDALKAGAEEAGMNIDF